MIHCRFLLSECDEDDQYGCNVQAVLRSEYMRSKFELFWREFFDYLEKIFFLEGKQTWM